MSKYNNQEPMKIPEDKIEYEKSNRRMGRRK